MKESVGMYDEAVLFVTRQGVQICVDGGRIIVWGVEGTRGKSQCGRWDRST